jgi:hypothetical protein
MTAQVCSLPAAIANALAPSVNDTVTGEVLVVPLPSPSCPLESLPQHLTDPVVSLAQVWSPPAATVVACTFATSFATLLLVVRPSPS